jgi:hypothetical protein
VEWGFIVFVQNLNFPFFTLLIRTFSCFSYFDAIGFLSMKIKILPQKEKKKEIGERRKTPL